MQSETDLTNFTRNAPLTCWHDDKLVGIFYVQDIVQSGFGLYTISATSAVGLLIDGIHYGGIYNGTLVNDIVASICGDVPYYLKSMYLETKLYGWLPVASPRDNLQQVLCALGANLKTDMDGVLRIEPLWNDIASDALKDRIYLGANAATGAKVTQVIVTEHQFLEGGDERKLFEGTAQNGNIITFSEPYYGFSATGFRILESGANYVKLSAGTGTLSGRSYIHNTRQVIRDVDTSPTPNVKELKDATLVSVVNSDAVANRLAGFYKHAQSIDQDVVYERELPGDRVYTYNSFRRIFVDGCIQSADLTLSNTVKSKETLCVGYVPDRSSQIGRMDKTDIISSSRTWAVPDGVTHLHAVLIGGGSGGTNGGNGTAGTAGASASIAYGESGSKTGKVGTAGKGGAAGLKGAAGKIYEFDADIPEGTQSITLTIGAGGAVGREGGATTLKIGATTYSSASGTSSEIGYTDITTGARYAYPGVDGVAGGDGGAAASSMDAEAKLGAAVGESQGGAASCGITRNTDDIVMEVTDVQKENDEWNVPPPELEIYDLPIVKRKSGYTELVYNPITNYYKGGEDIGIAGASGYTIYEGPVYTVTGRSSEIPPSALGPSTETYITEYKKYTADSVTDDYDTDIERVYIWTHYGKWIVTVSLMGHTVTLTTGTTGSGGGGAANRSAGGAASATSGGAGANAAAAAAAPAYGCGGNGGSGGGGGGAGGGGYVEYDGFNGSSIFSGTGAGASGGKGGKGSVGTPGAGGCAILYYSVPRNVANGQFVVRGDKMLEGKFARRFIV